MEFEEEHLRSILHIHEPVISLAIANLVELVHDTIDENVEDNLPQNATVPDLVKADDRLQPTVTEISMFEEAVRIAAKLRLASPGNKVESMWEKLVPNKVQARASKWFAAQGLRKTIKRGLGRDQAKKYEAILRERKIKPPVNLSSFYSSPY